MKLTKLIGTFTLIVACGAFTQQLYAASGAISLKMNAFKEQVVKDKDGKSKVTLVPIDSAVPGDKVVYVTEYKNITNKSVDSGAIIANRVPENTQYVANSAYCTDCEISYSIDGKRFDSIANLKVSLKDGSQRPANNSDIRHVRWRLNSAVEQQAQGTVGFKIKINESTL